LLNSWKEVRPPIYRIVLVRTKRYLYQRRVNKRYLNGDLFRSFADVSIKQENGLISCSNWDNLTHARVIFCESSILQTFLNTYGFSLSCEIIIAGNSDHDFHQLPANLPLSLKHLFLQNSFIPNSETVTCIPIGVENARYAVNGSARLMKNHVKWSERPGNLLFGPYGLTHPERIRTVRELFGSPDFDFLFGRLSPQKYSSVSSCYKFVACLRGNGIDTHRFWETVYRGGVPVVQDSIWAQNIKALNIPMVITSGWSVDDLNAALHNYSFSDLNLLSIPTLWPSYWKERIREFSRNS
jgi:hypothetical protein